MSYVKQCDKCKKLLTEGEKFVNASPVDTPAKEQLHLCQSCHEAFKRDFLKMPPVNTAANPQPMQSSPSAPSTPSVNPNVIR